MNPKQQRLRITECSSITLSCVLHLVSDDLLSCLSVCRSGRKNEVMGSLIALSSTNSEFKAILDNQSVWKSECYSHWPSLVYITNRNAEAIACYKQHFQRCVQPASSHAFCRQLDLSKTVALVTLRTDRCRCDGEVIFSTAAPLAAVLFGGKLRGYLDEWWRDQRDLQEAFLDIYLWNSADGSHSVLLSGHVNSKEEDGAQHFCDPDATDSRHSKLPSQFSGENCQLYVSIRQEGQECTVALEFLLLQDIDPEDPGELLFGCSKAQLLTEGEVASKLATLHWCT